MSRPTALVAFTLLASSAIGSVEAQSLRVSPVTIDLPPGASSSVFNLELDSKEGIAVQARVFRWSQADGEDKLQKTEDVVVSPPVLTVQGGASSIVRLVRVSQAPVAGEEAYRVLIDQIPDRKKLQAGAIALAIRQSVPVFFAGLNSRPGSLTWKTEERNHRLFVEATNAGQKRVRVSKLTVTDDKNREVVKIDGLAGYVLGGQSKAWPLGGTAAGNTLTIKAESATGPINATAIVGKSG